MTIFNANNTDLILGEYEEFDTISISEHKFALSQDERRRHIYAIGQTGTGKTTLLENLVLQDIYAGRGVTLIDPHGDIAHRIANSIPRHRLNDTVYFDAADRDHPIGFNPLSGVDSTHRELVASGIVAGFKGLWANSWGEWLEYLLKNSIMAILEYPAPGLSLAALPRFLQDTPFRNHVLKYVRDPEVRRFWENFFGELDQRQELERVSSTLNKAGKLTLSPTLRNILGQQRPGIDFKRVMDNNQILIINLSKGLLGADNSNLLGSLLVSHIVHLTMQRAAIPEEARIDHHLYIDEFQNFTTREFESILSEARKYRLCLTVAHQYLDQIDPVILKAVTGNVGTLAMFSLAAADALALEAEIAPVDATRLMSSKRGSFWVRYRKDGEHQEPRQIRGFPPVSDLDRNSLKRVINNARTRFATSRAKVEKQLAAWYANHK